MKFVRLLTLYYQLLLLHLASCAFVAETRDAGLIPFPVPEPDSTSQIFLPGVVCSDSAEFGSAFSPDGKSFYFARKSSSEGSQLYVSHYNGTKWGEPSLVPFGNIHYAEADPAFSPDGDLYFVSTRPKDQSDHLLDYDIWFVKHLDNRNWGSPQNVANVNSDSAEYYVSFSEDGNLYFASARAGGYGEEDLYVSKLINGMYTTPENLGPSINTKLSEYDPYIFPSEDRIIFTSSNRDDGFGNGDLYYSIITRSKKWSEGHNLGNKINTAAREFCPYITVDGQYLFFSSDGNIKWIGSADLKGTFTAKH